MHTEYSYTDSNFHLTKFDAGAPLNFFKGKFEMSLSAWRSNKHWNLRDVLLG